jgi:hypothetical protein
MADLVTCRIPRETLAGLIATTNNSDQQRITAPIPVQTLDSLLLEETAPTPAASESGAASSEGERITVPIPPTETALARSTPTFEVRFRKAVAARLGTRFATRKAVIMASCVATLLLGMMTIFALV